MKNELIKSIFLGSLVVASLTFGTFETSDNHFKLSQLTSLLVSL